MAKINKSVILWCMWVTSMFHVKRSFHDIANERNSGSPDTFLFPILWWFFFSFLSVVSFMWFMLLDLGWCQHAKLWKTASLRLWPLSYVWHWDFSECCSLTISGIYLHHWVKLLSILIVSNLDTAIKHDCPQLYFIREMSKCPSEYLIFHLLLLLLLLLTFCFCYYHCYLLVR